MPRSLRSAARRKLTAVSGLSATVLAVSIAGGSAFALAAPPALPAAQTAAAGLSVELTGPVTGVAGGQGSYIMTVVNRSTAASAVGFTVSESLPGGQSVLSVSSPAAGPAAGDWACVLGGEPSCTWSGPLAPGASTPPVTVEVQYAPVASGDQTSTATLSTADGQSSTSSVTTVLQPG